MSPDAFLVPTLVTYRMLEVHGRAAGLPRSMQAKVRGVFANALAGLEAAVRARTPIAFGTDLLGGLQTYQPCAKTIVSPWPSST
jgi:hypothetical protein